MNTVDIRHETTLWRNPTKDTVRLTFFQNRGQPRLQYEIPAGAERAIPKEFDHAVRYERNGIVMGGHAPMLVKVGEKPIPVHGSILEAAALAGNEGPTAGEAQRALEIQNAELTARLEALEAKLNAKGGK